MNRAKQTLLSRLISSAFTPWAAKRPAVTPPRSECTHPHMPMPEWDLEEAKRIQAAGESVAARFPRHYAKCQDCGWEGIVYASYEQYIMGDY